MKIKALTANEAMAEAMRQIDPDVVAAYPITPATEIVQHFASFVADGLVTTEFVPVESEHSAMSACIGAAAAGARVMTSTASQGLALMHEVLYIAAALRLPIVICEINRALSAPINIHCDHSDTFGARDSGWIQIYSEDSQEAYDSVIQAVRIAEEAFLPVMVTADGFILSHAMQRIEVLEDEEVKEFVGEPRAPYTLLDTDNPITVGPLDLQDYFFEHKRQEAEAMRLAPPIIERVCKEYGDRFGRYYGLVEPYRIEDAEVVVVVMGSTAGTAKEVVDKLREEGKPAGLLRIRVLRPLPLKEIIDNLKDKKVIGVMDRAEGMSGFGGPLYTEIRSTLYDLTSHPPIYNYIYGLGGRDIKPNDIEEIFTELFDASVGKEIPLVNYKGVRE